MFKIIIAGSREFNDYPLLKSKLDAFLAETNNDEVEIVSGTARGADILGERYASETGISIKRFPANWNLYGKRAGYIRNREMAEYADACIVFWNGESRGTKHMIDLATLMKLTIKVVQYE